MSAMRILIVDDFVMIRSLLKTSLSNLGFKNIDEARDGVEAYNKIAAGFVDEKPYQIVFLDWNMPNMTGLEVIQKCRAQEELKDLSFIMISAEQEEKKVKQAIDAGATDFIVKPFSPQVLVKKIEAIMLSKKSA